MTIPEDASSGAGLPAIAGDARARLDERSAARERALPAHRASIRHSANAIRATHRGDAEEAARLRDASRAALDEGREAARTHPEVFFAGFLQDAEKEYAEACLTAAMVAGQPFPAIQDLGVGVAPYLNGLAETVGEGRREVLDLLRRGEVEEGERILGVMDEIYAVLVSMDYPDAVTGNLRRSTDVARGIIEKTRGDLSVSLVARELRIALERHARDVLGRG